MRSALLLGGSAAGFLLPLGVLALWLHGVRASPLEFDFEMIPPLIGEWRRTAESRFDTGELSLVKPDAYRLWRFSDSLEIPITLYVALYRGLGETGAHSPEACYPAQGWEVLNSSTTTVPVAPDGELRVRVMRAERAGSGELVLFWFQHADRWPLAAGWEQVVRVYDTLRGHPQYAFVRLSVPVVGDTDRIDELKAFASSLAPRVRQMLEEAAQKSSS